MERDYSRCGGEKTWPEIIWRHRKLVVKPMIDLDCSFCKWTVLTISVFFISKTWLISSFQIYTSYTDDEERFLQPVWKKYWVLELIMISSNPLGILGFVWHHTWHQLQPMRPKNVKCRHCEDARYDPSEQMRPLGTSRGRGRLRCYLRCQQTLLVLLLVLL